MTQGLRPSSQVPRHVAIIMDGNGRWAKRRGLPRAFGHRKGVTALKNAVKFCKRRGIEVLTVYAFSTENWQRPPQEVAFLLELLKRTLSTELDELHEQNVRIHRVGDRCGVSQDVLDIWDQAEQRTAANTELVLNIAFNYGGRRDLTLVCRTLAQRAVEGAILPESIDEVMIQEHTLTNHCANPDLLIRTAGEMRISNFLLWQIAYTELYVTDILWPDFSDEAFSAALEDYTTRQRKFGRLNDTDSE